MRNKEQNAMRVGTWIADTLAKGGDPTK